MSYSFAGFPLPEADVRAVDDGVTVMQDDGEPVTRWRTETLPPPAPFCACSHARREHMRDAGRCSLRACGCGSFRPMGDAR